ncbi:three-helix bundle dimerization domain-containing protein [Arthrobacter sp. KNU-44]|uniref:three-helix bundle dimerization domain-containing protein n=1 Tax=unclassified Arthrobacter TaxID=235627 RepID=UPI003F41E1BB
MTMEDEQLALETVVARLASRYPAASREQVEHIVRKEHEALVGPIRDYIPILVEHRAKGRLRDSPNHEGDQRETEATGLPAHNPA